MKLSSNIIKFHDELGLKKTIDVFSEAGFEEIDFNTDLKEYHTDKYDETFYRNIKKYANEKGIGFAQTHAPFASSFTDQEKTKQRFDEIVRSMKHSSWLGAQMIVIHPCKHMDYRKENNSDLMIQYNLDFYKKLIPYAEAYELKISIENIPDCITETSEGLLTLLNTLNNDVFNVCYDVGHANICGQDPVDMIRKLGKKIGCTHIHDNDGICDTHTLPYYGTIDWESVMKAFADIEYEGNLNYEAGLFLNKAPIALRNDSAKYMAKVGKYLIDRYLFYKNNI